MNVNVLIDAIVRQTTVLIAQLATAAGIRAPLAHTANQVFLDLVHELKQQGLGNKVIADMFGLALSTYQTKVRRLAESRSVRGRSLWEATLEYVRQEGTVPQANVLRRFHRDDEATVRGVLADLVDSGMIFRSGRGDHKAFRAARPEELSASDATESHTALVNLVWLAVHRSGSCTASEIAALVPLEPSQLDKLLEELVRDGRVLCTQSGSLKTFNALECVIEMGEPGGWEAAVFDHYQAMVVALCAKLRRGRNRARFEDVIGGSTYGFTVWPGHPHQEEVLGFLPRMRQEAGELRRKVREFNAANKPPAGETIGVIAYVGQTVLETEREVEA